MKGKQGRETKFSPERSEKLVALLRQGNYIETACEYAGISTSTYYRWLQEADEPDAPQNLLDFRDTIKVARAEAEARNVAYIQSAAQGGTWQAAAWWLERSQPNKWGRQQKLLQEITGANGEPLDMKSVVLGFLTEQDEADPIDGTLI